MDAEARYAINAGTVAAKVIEGEAIVINVVTGRYHSLEGPAAVAWAYLAAGASADATGVAIAARYDVDAAAAGADVARLGAELAAADLLVPAAAGAPAAVDEDALGAPPPAPAPYTPPALQTFDDMEDLLAFDPPLPAAEFPDEPWSPA